MPTKQTIYHTLQQVKDPEIPTVSLIEMGIIRDVTVDVDAVTVTITPTFSGCPALFEMERLIKEKVQELGVQSVQVDIARSPAWTSDWITEEGRRKLKEFGLQPPQQHGGNIMQTFFDDVPCPRCDSTNTTIKNSFGSTLCRAIWYCNQCQEPFEQFKAL